MVEWCSTERRSMSATENSIAKCAKGHWKVPSETCKMDCARSGVRETHRKSKMFVSCELMDQKLLARRPATRDEQS